jgi:hypothetical protein
MSLGWKGWARRFSPWRHFLSVAKAGAVAPFFWSGKAHGQQRNTHLQSYSIALWRSRI